MLNLPSEVTVCGRTYDVRVERDVTDDGGDLEGNVTFQEGVIRIAARANHQNMSDDAQAIALLHEMVHAVLQGVPLLIRDLPAETREEWIDTFSSMWADTVQRNGLCALNETVCPHPTEYLAWIEQSNVWHCDQCGCDIEVEHVPNLYKVGAR